MSFFSRSSQPAAATAGAIETESLAPSAMIALRNIGMHDSAWTGEYYFLDQPVHRLGAKERAKLHKQYIGFVFQSYHLLDHLTVYENLDIPLSYRDIKKAERESMV